MNKRKFALITVAATSILAITGCAGGVVPGLPISSPTPEPVYVSAPLTGVKYLEGSAEATGLSNPSVACKIDNSEAARPQQNLNKTDVVFDEMVEGGLTQIGRAHV